MKGRHPLPWVDLHSEKTSKNCLQSISLFFPYAARYSQLQLPLIAARKEECQVPWDDQPVVALTHPPVAVADAPRDSLPDQPPAVPTHLQAVTEALCLVVISHEPQQRHVHGRCPQLEGLKVQAEVFAEAVEYSKHPCGIFHLKQVRFHISMVEGAPYMHVNLVITLEMCDKCWDVS